jgi:putative peptide zinc metalloprotease protein
MLRRQDFLDAMGSDPKVAMRMFELLQVRGRPRQAKGVEVHQRTASDGAVIYYLKNPEKGTYYKLTERGYFLWEQLSGSNGVRELVAAWFAQFATFDPGSIAQILRGLAMAGFLHGIDLSPQTALKLIKLKWWQRALLSASKLLDWRYTARNVDPAFQRLYDGGVKFAFTRVSLTILALISLAGFAAFIATGAVGRSALAANAHSKWLLIPSFIVCTVLHEASHAFTTKHFKRQVNGMGFGWYRFGPVAFIDTSDMWLGGKWERIAVTAAGPLMNIILAGIASLAILAARDPLVVAGLWQFAVLTYMLVLLNMNPLLELDGYYLVMDWLERPNFRTKSLRWLVQELPDAIKNSGELKAHKVELAYGITTFLYAVGSSFAFALSLRAIAANWIPKSFALAVYMPYALAGLFVVLMFTRIANDFRGNSA